MFSTADTIVALATAAGRAGIGVVRVSGRDAAAIVGKLIPGRALRPRYATVTRLSDDSQTVLDEVVLTWFEAPHSYTREHVVEIAAHGNPIVLRRIVELVVNGGARLAEPGEFTLRAYLNGRIDLVQAEAVADLVDAVTPLQARSALDQLEGTLTSRIAAIEAKLFDLVARLEASIDFPEEGFHFVTRAEAERELGALCDELERLRADGRRGRMIREGALVAIVGLPNAGKSSLFNALLCSERAIVAELPGTTRDTLTERVEIDGLSLTLIDTAGIRSPTDTIEAEGIRRAEAAREGAALTILVVDGSQPLSPRDLDLMEAGCAIVAVNKADLCAAWTLDALGGRTSVVRTSAITGEGLEELRHLIVSELTGRDSWRDTPAITNVRHLALIDAALEGVESARHRLALGETEELVLAELAPVRDALESVTGRRCSEDTLREVFARFCVGK